MTSMRWDFEPTTPSNIRGGGGTTLHKYAMWPVLQYVQYLLASTLAQAGENDSEP